MRLAFRLGASSQVGVCTWREGYQFSRSFSSSVVDTLLSTLHEQNYVRIPSSTMKSLLQVDQVDSCSMDFDALWNNTAMQRDESNNEVYPFKRSMVSYFDHLQRISPAHQSIEHIDSSTNHNVSYYRVHKSWPVNSDNNPILKAYRDLLFQVVLPSFVQDDLSNYSAMQTAFRVTHDPGPEGVHSDDCILTAVTLISRNNCHPSSGKNRIWSLEQEYGKPSAQDLDSERLLYETTLSIPFDTILLLDRKVKHEVTLLEPYDDSNHIQRDVLTFEVRRKSAFHQNDK
jgi:hypothetical protein